jgi:hypothetical protein
MDTAAIEPVLTDASFRSLYDSLFGTMAAIAFGFAYFFGTNSGSEANTVDSESAASPVPMDLREDPPVPATPQTSMPARVSVGKA